MTKSTEKDQEIAKSTNDALSESDLKEVSGGVVITKVVDQASNNLFNQVYTPPPSK